MAISKEKITKVKTALDNRYEKNYNKKSTIPIEPGTNDYPTSNAVKEFVEGKGYITQQDISGKEDKTNKVTSWHATTSDSRYPSEKLVKDSLDNKVDSSTLSNFIEKSSTNGLVKNDGTIDTNTYLTSQDISGKEDSSNKVTSWSETVTNAHYPSEKLVKDSLDNKVDKENGKGLFSGSYNDLTNKPSIPTKTSDLTNDGDGTHTFLTQHQSLESKTVTVEKQTTAEEGYISTYIVKQGNNQVGEKINIPKDYLVKSATMETCSVANTPVSGYQIGDKYLDFVINTKDNSGTAEHLYILVSDLIDTYTAGTGLTLSNNEFSISNGDISLTMLATGIQTSIGYADAYHSSPASTITSTQITDWDTMASGGTTISDIDNEINQALDDLAEAIFPTSS